MKIRTNKKLWWAVVILWTVAMLVFVSDVFADNAYVAVGIGAGQNGNAFRCSICWDDAGATGSIMYLRYRNRIYRFADGSAFSGCELWVGGDINHFSQWEVGPPNNDTDESSLDSIMAVIELRSNL